MKQQEFLRIAKRELGFTYPALATELGVSPRTMEKWAMDSSSPDHRPLPLMARRFILRLLEERKRERLSAGDRTAAETIDAIAAQVDPERLARSLRSFDLLQRSAKRFMPGPARPKPAFSSAAAKNRWERDQETRDARRVRAQATRNR